MKKDEEERKRYYECPVCGLIKPALQDRGRVLCICYTDMVYKEKKGKDK